MWGLPARRTMYEPISPVKNMTSVARKSHIATLPGETGAVWVGTGAWPPACPAGFGWAVLGVAIAIVGSTLRGLQKGHGPPRRPLRCSSMHRGTKEQQE